MATTFPQFSYSPAKIRRVKHMQFGVLSPTELVRWRVLVD